MRTVNYFFIDNALDALMVAEAKRGAPLDLDPNDEASSKRQFKEFVVPFVATWPNWRRAKLKDSLAYYLDQPEILDQKVLAAQQDLTLLDFDDVGRFFRWLWETLYPGDNYRDVDLLGVVENNDVMETNPQPEDRL